MGWGPGLNKQEKKASQLPKASEVMSLKREFTTSILLNQHNSFATSNLVFIPADKCSYLSSSKKLLCTENVDLYRKLQEGTKQRWPDCREPSYRDHICSTAPASVTQGTSRERGQKGGKSQKVSVRRDITKSAVRLPLRNDCRNETWPMTISIGMPRW